MSVFFSDFPKIKYNFNGTLVPVTNLLVRFRPLLSVIKQSRLYYDYSVKEDERSDILADRIYGNSEYEWIIIMFNQIIDPYFQWFMGYDLFNKYLEVKYGSYEQSTQLVHHYEWITQPKQTFYDGSTIDEETLIIDQATYLSLPADETRLVYCYDYEVQKNETRRQIQLIDSIYIPQILNEKVKIFK